MILITSLPFHNFDFMYEFKSLLITEKLTIKYSIRLAAASIITLTADILDSGGRLGVRLAAGQAVVAIKLQTWVLPPASS